MDVSTVKGACTRSLKGGGRFVEEAKTSEKKKKHERRIAGVIRSAKQAPAHGRGAMQWFSRTLTGERGFLRVRSPKACVHRGGGPKGGSAQR